MPRKLWCVAGNLLSKLRSYFWGGAAHGNRDKIKADELRRGAAIC